MFKELDDVELKKFNREAKKYIANQIFNSEIYNIYLIRHINEEDSFIYSNLIKGELTDEIIEEISKAILEKDDYSLDFDDFIKQQIHKKLNLYVFKPMAEAIRAGELSNLTEFIYEV